MNNRQQVVGCASSHQRLSAIVTGSIAACQQRSSQEKRAFEFSEFKTTNPSYAFPIIATRPDAAEGGSDYPEFYLLQNLSTLINCKIYTTRKRNVGAISSLVEVPPIKPDAATPSRATNSDTNVMCSDVLLRTSPHSAVPPQNQVFVLSDSFFRRREDKLSTETPGSDSWELAPVRHVRTRSSFSATVVN